jgi:hypothetical protein
MYCNRPFVIRILTVIFLFSGSLAVAQQVGDRVRLEATNPAGVPVHLSAGDNSFVRWANGTTGKVAAIDPATRWYKIESADKVGWIVGKYLIVIPPEPEQPPTPPDGNELPTYVVGSWNLEHFHDGQTRGFPENTSDGPSYGQRTAADFMRIANIIQTQLVAKILILNEINGRPNSTESDEMNRLVGALGSGWVYSLARSGDVQRIAILYDTAAVRKDNCVELNFPAQSIQGKDVFARDPLACHFTFLGAGGEAKNDFILVGLHLAAGQDLVQNHNEAMNRLRTKLHELQTDGTFPAGENDVLMGGDLNASRYDNKQENFWEGYDTGGFNFRTLSPVDGEEYLPTRLAGVPLFPKSQIDYLIASNQTGGLGTELVQLLAEVHHELLAAGFDDYRAHVSDHIPVTVRIRVVQDDD